MNKKLRATLAAVCILAIIVSAVFIFIFLKNRSSSEDDAYDGPTIDDILNADYAPIELEENGVKVRYDQNTYVRNYLLMGIDKDGKAVSNGSYNNDGQADALFVLSVNHDAKTYSLLQINRDTMTDVYDYDVFGRPSVSSVKQIALAHNAGDGMHSSCLNTVKAVSDYLYGTKFSGYAALNMGGIRALNDAVGGVEVLIEDDFSETDPSLVMGETVNLTGDQAYRFLRARGGVGNETNIERMARHAKYVESFVKKVMKQVANDTSVAVDLYDGIIDYSVTNLSAAEFSNLFTDLVGYEFSGLYKIDGHTEVGEFMEFYPDKASLENVLKTLFFHKA